MTYASRTASRLAIRERTQFAHPLLNLLVSARQRDAHVVLRDCAEAAAGGDGDVAGAQQLPCQLAASARLPVAFACINEDVEGSVRSIEIAAMLAQDIHGQVAASLVCLAHFAHTILG